MIKFNLCVQTEFYLLLVNANIGKANFNYYLVDGNFSPIVNNNKMDFTGSYELAAVFDIVLAL